jgi:pimeloyl-ACP methyl ester carboxylesterase
VNESAPRALRTALLVALMTVARPAVSPIGACSAAEPLAFRVTLEQSVTDQPISGRLYVFLSTGTRGEPRFGPNWLNPEPFFGIDVADFRPPDARTVDDAADGFPGKLSKLPPDRYRVQAVLHHSFDSSHPGRAAGNFFSRVREVNLDPAESGTIELLLDQVVQPRANDPPSWSREIALTSRLLSEFHGREVVQRASVILPPSYDERPDQRYPTVYIIPGFGGSHQGRQWRQITGPREANQGEVEFIRVMLGGQCRWGHHVYANSATNGPRGDALVEELIPYVDANFRTVSTGTARFVTGHSSGGWSSLWLQVSYPDLFGGVWSQAPDPVDFRDFQQIDIHAEPPLNMYRDERGNRRPIARRGGRPILWYDSFCRMDDVLGRGGQMRSFEAVFSPLGADGEPQRLWDRTTGQIDPQVARAWRKYDIGAILTENWDTLGPKLQGKLHITAAGLDTFYLDGAVKLLAQRLRELGSDAEIEIVPGASHSSFLTPDRIRTIRRQMSAAYRKHHSPTPAPVP